MTDSLVTCPGCGLRLPPTKTFADERFSASAECWQAYGDLAGYTLSHPDPAFLHQLAVDAYAAQHAGPRMRPITLAFALIGLYLVHERGYSGREVQKAHMLLASRTKQWPSFAPPTSPGALTVQDVLQAAPGIERDLALEGWSAAVWEAWKPAHDQVERLVELWLDQARPERR